MLVETRINILSFQNDEKFVTIFEKQLNVTVTPDYDPESIQSSNRLRSQIATIAE